MRLVIGGPTLATVPARFALDLAHLYAYTGDAGAVFLRFVQSTYVHVGREAVLEAALQIGASHVLWLDTDMTFPEDTALRLAAHDQAIVAANCVLRDPRILFTAERNGQRVETRPDSTGLEAVDSIGLAVVLMRTDVVADLPRPWFQHGRTEAGVDIGEDRMFCRALRAAGHQIWIDHDLSKEIGHIGQHTYRPASAAVSV
ncbi:MAG TPA: hypothetical protein VGP95_08030 [Gemmatimonadaceae bacterium]|jgi:hypothetical protein|nr:hypothetical protein [Gemmatimonadaceae bacterium]